MPELKVKKYDYFSGTSPSIPKANNYENARSNIQNINGPYYGAGDAFLA